MKPTTPEARVGTTLADKYELVQLLGVGGSGAVFEARHHRTGARYAIKLPLQSADRAESERMLREARALAKLEHEHVVRLVDLDEDGDGELYLVEELLRGRTLRALLDEELLLSPRRALELLVPILRGLGYAHDRGIVHRDLKPENIFLSEDASGRVTPKLLDFGLVREATTPGGTTRPGTLLGTPRYMSPEQAWGREDVDGRSDLWSLAVVLYECLSGVCPFDGANDRAVLAAIVTTDAPHLRSMGVVVDEALADAVMLALTRAPESRVPSAAAWEAALADVPSLAAEPWHGALFAQRASATAAVAGAPGSTPEPRDETGVRRATFVLSTLAVAALVALCWIVLQTTPNEPASEPTDTQTTETQTTGTQATGTQTTGTQATGTQTTGTQTTGMQTTGIQTTGTLPRGSRTSDAHGTDREGRDGALASPNDTTGSPTDETADPHASRTERTTGTSTRPPPTTPLRETRPGTTETAPRADAQAPASEPARPSAGPNAAPLVDDL